MIGDTSQTNIFDTGALTDLQRKVREKSPEANKAVAQQFEALFLQMMLKSMRQTLQGDGLGESENTRFYQGMQDQQLSLVLSKKGGIGLSAALERMMNAQAGTVPASALDLPGSTSQTAPSSTTTAVSAQSAAVSAGAGMLGSAVGSAAQSFVAQTWPQAQAAASSLGVPPHFLVAQAALETGWGKSELRRANGSPSYNLFNIKAGRDWQGDVVEAKTTEYENGKMVSRTERFRAYSSYAEAFADYAKLVGNSPRYAAVAGKTDPREFAQALQSAGYATDPAYASKLTRVINGNSMRQGMLASATTHHATRQS